MFGQKTFRVLELEKGEPIKFLHVSEVVQLADWLLDVTWLDWKDPDNYEVVAITAHNVLVKHKLVDGNLVSTQYQNEVRCILYPEHLVLAVACGLIVSP